MLDNLIAEEQTADLPYDYRSAYRHAYDIVGSRQTTTLLNGQGVAWLMVRPCACDAARPPDPPQRLLGEEAKQQRLYHDLAGNLIDPNPVKYIYPLGLSCLSSAQQQVDASICLPYDRLAQMQ